MPTTEITLVVPLELADTALGALALDGIGCELRDGGTIEKAPPGCAVVAIFVDEAEAEALATRVTAILSDAGIAATPSSRAIGDDWIDAWKRFFVPRPVGKFVIVPSWERYVRKPGETIISLDPGRAFGTGGHASTRLVMRLLGDVQMCTRFLDVGCGSGVLAIACALVWPSATGAAIDVDPVAVDVTRENAEINQVTARIDASTTLLDDVAGTFDVVLANITAETIALLADGLAAHVAPGGTLLASGILVEEGDRVAAAMTARGLRLAGSLDEEGWRGLRFVKP